MELPASKCVSPAKAPMPCINKAAGMLYDLEMTVGSKLGIKLGTVSVVN